MSRFLKLSVFLLGLVASLFCLSAQAREVIAIITPVPMAKETIEIPGGYERCYTVRAGWYRNMWVPKHRVCRYRNQPGRTVWVEGYWQCIKFKHRTCRKWDWVPGHWGERVIVY